jgi:hypothetical protein
MATHANPQADFRASSTHDVGNRTCGRNNLFGSWLLIASLLFSLCATAFSSPFPIAQFKDFISNKGTIEICEFEVQTTKFNRHGLREGTYRRFAVSQEGDDKYRLIEDQRTYLITSEIPRFEDGMVLRTMEERHPLIQLQCWIRFGDDFQSTYSPYSFITHSLGVDGLGKYGPAVASEGMIRVARDVLSLGIVGICDATEVTWSGNSFVCPSNIHGNRLSGTLTTGEDERPVRLDYDFVDAIGQRYSRSVAYTFAVTESLPAFFPSNLRIDFVKDNERSLLSEYRISRLKVSNRRLTRQDLAYVAAPYTNPPIPIGAISVPRPTGTNLMEFVFTNGQVHRVETNSAGARKLIPLPANVEPAASKGLD